MSKLGKYFIPVAMIYVSLAIILIAFTLSFGVTSSIQDVVYGWSAVSLFILLGFSVIFYLKYKSFNKPFFYFVIAAFVCWFGQLIVGILPIQLDTPSIIESFSPVPFHHALAYATSSLFILCLVGLFFGSNSDEKNYTKAIENKSLKTSLNLVGILLTLVGAYPYLSRLITNFSASLRDGYASLYDVMPTASSVDNILTNFSLFFIPGLIILLVANKGRKLVTRVILLILIVTAFISLATGGRGGAITLLISLFWLYSTEFKKIKKKSLLLVVLVGICMIALLGAIAEFRISDDRSLEAFIGIVFSGGGIPVMVAETLNEFGFNIFSLYHTMELIPSSQGFANGYTYFASVMAIIPSFFFGGYSFSTAAALPDWLKDKLAMDYGPGFSITAESYYNFGLYGLIAIAIIGIFLIKIMSNKETNPDKKSIRNIFIAIALYATLFIARDTTLLTIRKCFYMILVPMLLIWLVYYWRKRNSKQGGVSYEK